MAIQQADLMAGRLTANIVDHRKSSCGVALAELVIAVFCCIEHV